MAVFLLALLDFRPVLDTHASIHSSSFAPFYCTNFTLSDSSSMLFADASFTSLIVAVIGRTDFHFCPMLPTHSSILCPVCTAVGRAFLELSTVPSAYSSIDGEVGTAFRTAALLLCSVSEADATILCVESAPINLAETCGGTCSREREEVTSQLKG